MHIEPSTVNVTGLRISFQQLKMNLWLLYLHERSYHEEIMQIQVRVFNDYWLSLCVITAGLTALISARPGWVWLPMDLNNHYV